jgi:hypothetical protein
MTRGTCSGGVGLRARAGFAADVFFGIAHLVRSA